jgi:glucose/arabinose dehydrogenase
VPECPPPVRRTSALIALTVGFLCATPARAAPTLTPVGSFSKPALVTGPTYDAERIFVVERVGRVKVVKNGSVLPRPFVDVSTDIDPARTGLASMAFAPDYDTSGRFYVLYSAPDAANTEKGVDVVIDAFTRSAADFDVADPASRRNVLRLDFSNTADHDADHIAFGPDGYLYLTVGDGKTGFNLAQDPSEPRGKLFRIDPRPDETPPYRIPPTNPYADGGGMPEVYAYGLRNPWRFAFTDDEIVVSDVGGDRREEVTVLPLDLTAAPNLGWPCWEGSVRRNVSGPCASPKPQVAPTFEYDHSDGRCAIIGGYVSRDASVPELLGRYVYGDFCTGELRSVDLGAPADDERWGAMPPFGPSSFGEDGCGRLYVTYNSDGTEGNVRRIDGDQPVPCPQRPRPDPGPEPQPQRQPDPESERRPQEQPDPRPPADTAKPKLSLGGARHQHVARNRRVVIATRCSETCSLNVTVSPTRAALFAPFAARPIRVEAGARRRIAIPVPEPARDTLAQRAAVLRVAVVASDDAGNATRRVRHVAALIAMGR